MQKKHNIELSRINELLIPTGKKIDIGIHFPTALKLHLRNKDGFYCWQIVEMEDSNIDFYLLKSQTHNNSILHFETHNDQLLILVALRDDFTFIDAHNRLSLQALQHSIIHPENKTFDLQISKTRDCSQCLLISMNAHFYKNSLQYYYDNRMYTTDYNERYHLPAVPLHIDHQSENLVAFILNVLKSANKIDSLRLGLAVKTYLTVILDQLNTEENRSEDDFIRTIKLIADELSENPFSFPGIDVMAKRCYVNTTKFKLAFHKTMGMSAYEFWKVKRIAFARKLILEEGYTPTAAAEKLGFSDLPALTKSFKSVYGHPPSKLIR